MKDICFFRLSNKVEGFWANPTSGFGNICDEQPLPYFKLKNYDISPRLGGEVGKNLYNEKIIPLPYGKLKNSWPIKQRFFNLRRKKTNLYWKRIFESNCPSNKLFLFYSQLNYKIKKRSFIGQCPIMIFKRKFVIEGRNFKVFDKIIFKENISYEYLHINPLLKLNIDIKNVLDIKTSLKPNTKTEFQSSTGKAIYTSHRIDNCKFSKGDQLNTNIEYIFL